METCNEPRENSGNKYKVKVLFLSEICFWLSVYYFPHSFLADPQSHSI